VSTEKQHQIDKDDLRVLSDKNTDPAVARHLLVRYELAGGRQLKKLDAFLGKIAVKDHPLFNKVNLSTLLSVQARLKGEANHRTVELALMQEAAAFAIEQAQTPADFATRYQFYLCCAKKLRLEEDTPTSSGAHINQMLAAM